jgi:hypothetical protein
MGNPNDVTSSGLDGEFDELIEKIKENEPLKRRFERVNKDLGVEFSDYFQVKAMWELNRRTNVEHSVPLVSADTFKNLEDQKRELKPPSHMKRVLFKRGNGERYLVSIYIKEDSQFKALVDYQFLKYLFWTVDPRHDVEESTVANDDKERMVIHYYVERGEYIEDLYVEVVLLG